MSDYLMENDYCENQSPASCRQLVTDIQGSDTRYVQKGKQREGQAAEQGETPQSQHVW